MQEVFDKIVCGVKLVFMNIYNDVSFMFNSTLQLYEHQSTSDAFINQNANRNCHALYAYSLY